MAAPPAIPVTDDDRASLRRSLLAAVRVLGDGGQEVLAKVLLVGSSTLSEWISGRDGKAPAPNVVRAAFVRASKLHPHLVPELVRVLAMEWCGSEGEWIPAGSSVLSALGDFRDEAGDVQIALANLMSAHRRCAAPGELQRHEQELLRQVREAIAASQLSTTRSA